MPPNCRSQSEAAQILRRFFETRVPSTPADAPSSPKADPVSTDHAISHLVGRTIRRAALRRAAQSHRANGTVTRWKEDLLVAALIELRAVGRA